jgi:prohibitin 2
MSRYTKIEKRTDSYGRSSTDIEVIDPVAIIRDASIAIALIILLIIVWPFNSVPTGSRGVVTRFGRITGIENEGLAILLPWQKLTLFSIRAEAATIEDASGATSDTQPVDVSLTVRYSISPDKVSEVFE